MRKVHGLVFMGRGKHSEADCDVLRKRLEDAISLVSGLQQSAPSPDDVLRTQTEIDDCIRDIAAGLLGVPIVIVNEQPLPYPPVLACGTAMGDPP